MEIRLRTGADLPALLDALQATHAVDKYPVLPNHVTKEWLLEGDDGMAWVAEDGGEVVGHIAVAETEEDPDSLSVHRLFVRPSARGHGVASSLLTTVETYSKILGQDLFLEVLSHNVDAMRLYESRGYRLIGRYARYYADDADALRYEKRLPGASRRTARFRRGA